MNPGGGVFLGIFVYASTDDYRRAEQWNFLLSRRSYWGSNWLLGGDFNDIRYEYEKKGGRARMSSSFQESENV